MILMHIKISEGCFNGDGEGHLPPVSQVRGLWSRQSGCESQFWIGPTQIQGVAARVRLWCACQRRRGGRARHGSCSLGTDHLVGGTRANARVTHVKGSGRSDQARSLELVPAPSCAQNSAHSGRDPQGKSGRASRGRDTRWANEAALGFTERGVGPGPCRRSHCGAPDLVKTTSFPSLRNLGGT